MPCWEVNTMSVKIEAANKELLEKAAKAMGLYIYNYGKERAYGPILIQGDMPLLNRLKVEYSRQVVEKVAKAKGWTGSWMKNTEKPTVKLRRY